MPEQHMQRGISVARHTFSRRKLVRKTWQQGIAALAVFGLLGGMLGVGLISLAVVGGTTRAGGGVEAPATWSPNDLPVSGQLTTSPIELPGTSGALEYAYGVDYAGPSAGSGAAISGADVPGGVIRILQGDTLTGSAAAWNGPVGGGPVGVSLPSDGEAEPGSESGTASAGVPTVAVRGVTGQSPDATLRGQLTVISLPSIDPGAETGVAQSRWQIAQADADSVNADGHPATLQAGFEGALDSADRAAVRVFVVDPRLEETLEVCAKDDGCDPDAAAGTGGWASDATLSDREAPVLWRVNVTNTGNIDLTDVRIVTAANDALPLYASDGIQLGDIPAGGATSEAFTSAAPVSGDIQAEVAVSGVFTANAPDGTDLARRFTDTAGTTGRVPSNTAHAAVSFTASEASTVRSDVSDSGGLSPADAGGQPPTADVTPRGSVLRDIMPWSFSLAVVADPAGYGGKAVYTGTAGWDANSNPGYDANASNNLVRSNDLVMYSWSIAASQQVSGGATSAAGTVFEQTITMQPGAVVNFSVIPAVCGAGSTITAYPSGTSVAAKEIPPSGTTSVVLSCEFGNVASGARLLSTQVWVAPDSKNASTFSSTARVYTHDPVIATPVTLDPALPVTVSAAPLWDVSVTGGVTYGGVLRTFNGVDNTMVDVIRYDVGVANGSFPNSTTQQGSDATCDFARTSPTNLNSSYTLTLSNITQNGVYPTQMLAGGSLLNGPYYSTTFEFETMTPLSVLDAAVGAASDGVGQATLYARVSGFDPNGVSGQSNYGAGTGASAVEPGYCSATANPAINVSQITTVCANMPGGGRSNDVSGPFTVEISPGSWGKYLGGEVDAWTVWDALLPGSGNWHDGAGMVAPGQTYDSEQVLSNTGSVSFTGAQMCDVFDNTVVALSPLKNLNDIDNASLLPDNLYSYVLNSDGGSVADQQAFNQNFTVEYAHVNLTGDDPFQAWDAANDRYKGTWTAQANAKCATVPSGNWKTDPTQVAGGLNAVNIVRVRQNSELAWFLFRPVFLSAGR